MNEYYVIMVSGLYLLAGVSSFGDLTTELKKSIHGAIRFESVGAAKEIGDKARLTSFDIMKVSAELVETVTL